MTDVLAELMHDPLGADVLMDYCIGNGLPVPDSGTIELVRWVLHQNSVVGHSGKVDRVWSRMSWSGVHLQRAKSGKGNELLTSGLLSGSGMISEFMSDSGGKGRLYGV